MPWRTHTIMSQRLEFVSLASSARLSFKELCRRFGISRKTGYKWKKRFLGGGAQALSDQSRQPHRQPRRCAAEVAAAVIAVREENPTWGGRKLRRRLQDLGEEQVPSASTCTAILRRANRLRADRPSPGPWQRFVRSVPNELWQMDFKGQFQTQRQGWCFPLAVIDDHSRFNLALSAEGSQTGPAVQTALKAAFCIYGLPEALLCDNGPPWGSAESPHTALTVWLLRLGVKVIHGRAWHPQTQGKTERFNRTLSEELLSQHTWTGLDHCEREFGSFRYRYNYERPHDALGGDTPSRHYQPSSRPWSGAPLPPIEYPSTFKVCRVYSNGLIVFGNQSWGVGRAFAGLPIGLRPSAQADGQWEVYFTHHRLGHIDLTPPLKPKRYLRSIYPEPPY
jgi:transposase InsO family protein